MNDHEWDNGRQERVNFADLQRQWLPPPDAEVGLAGADERRSSIFASTPLEP